jgi:hypothetical protein
MTIPVNTMQAAARLLREEADAELEEANEDMRPENDGITQQRRYTTQDMVECMHL